MPPKTLIVNPHHWLKDDGSLPDDSRVRARAIRIAQCIEYGASLAPGEYRSTLVACRRRPNGRPCDGLLQVDKGGDTTLLAHCPKCGHQEYSIHDWQSTPWAFGPALPERFEPPAPHEHSLESWALRMRCPIDANDMRALLQDGDEPAEVLSQVLDALPHRPSAEDLDGLLSALHASSADMQYPRPNAQPISALASRLAAPSAPSPSSGLASDTWSAARLSEACPCPCGSPASYADCCLQRNLH